MPTGAPQLICNQSSTTTPALTTSAASSNTGGVPAGRSAYQLVIGEFIRGATSITGVTITLYGSRDGVTFIQLPFYDASTTAKTLVTTINLTGSAGTTNDIALCCDAMRAFPFIDLKAQAITANAATGDSFKAWLNAV